ncbi:hypothetical protein STEG23_027447, partial [Scotinomys teguina]
MLIDFHSVKYAVTKEDTVGERQLDICKLIRKHKHSSQMLLEKVNCTAYTDHSVCNEVSELDVVFIPLGHLRPLERSMNKTLYGGVLNEARQEEIHRMKSTHTRSLLTILVESIS